MNFWSNIRPLANGCWQWIGPTNGKGYGRGSIDGKNQYAHRYSYIIHVGPIPAGFFVCHKCDNRSCVSPDHLFLGTAKDNTQDMYKKGREKHVTKLQVEDVSDIRDLWDSKKFTQYELANMFFVNQSQISRIVNKKRRAKK